MAHHASKYDRLSLAFHKKHRGKMGVFAKARIKNAKDLSTLYTPGVAAPSALIARHKDAVFTHTIKANTVAVVTNGTAVLGLGDVGPEAALPVMEGKAILFKEFAGIDAWPICIKTKKVDEFVAVVKELQYVFGGINLEDIAAPECFEIEEKLQRALPIPVFHDDQHGTAIVVLAGLLNACKVTGRKLEQCKVVISGAGAAGLSIAKILLSQKVRDPILCDHEGPIYAGRKDLNRYKKALVGRTNLEHAKTLTEAMKDADIFVGVSVPDVVNAQMVKSMALRPIVFAMSNPDPEIRPEEAKKGGAAVIATGRSDFPNQINNVLAFPGIFRGALDGRIKTITPKMHVAAAHALAKLVKKPSAKNIIPSVFAPNVCKAVANAVKRAR